jgi:hypothetical protein
VEGRVSTHDFIREDREVSKPATFLKAFFAIIVAFALLEIGRRPP